MILHLGALAEAYDSYFLPRDTRPGFGVRKWAILLNQTEAMLSAHYVHDTLSAVTDVQLLKMRKLVARYMLRLSWIPTAAAQTKVRAALASTDVHVLAGDASSYVVERVLRLQRGAPVHTRHTIPSDFALEYRPLASTDGRVCATYACRHRMERGVCAPVSIP